MKQQLLSIADYLESLEQRIAALEEKLETLEKPEPEPVLQPSTCNLQPAPDPEPVLQPSTCNLQPAPDPEPVLQPATCNLQPAPDPEPVLQPATCNLQPALGSVSNIRQAISLGDRFLFQRELFANNGELMQKTLDEINDCANMDEALQSVAHFNWDPESTTYKLFLNVLKRRF